MPFHARNPSALLPGGALSRRGFGAMGLGALAAMGPRPATAEIAWPDRPIRYVVPYGPGGAIDTLSRSLAQGFPALANNQPLVVENRSGAGGSIAGAFVASSKPDGYTLMMADIGPNAVAGEIYKGLPYDPATAFTPILHVANLPMALIARNGLEVKDLADLIAQARAKPDGFTFSSAGAGNASHLFMELLMKEAGIKMVHVPYRSGAEQVSAVLKGEADISLPTASSALSYIRAGNVRVLATGSAKPIELVPDAPTIASTVPNFTVFVWHGVIGPAGMPAEMVAKANGIFARIIAQPEVIENARKMQGAEMIGGSPEDFKRFIQGEIDRWGPVARAANVREN